MNTSDYVIIFMKILGSLALLIYGMKVMSEALQKMAGSQLRHILGAMTTNRFTGMLTGVFITCAVQSSSATTVMTVSFVNAGLLTLAQAISVIMGAIGILSWQNWYSIFVVLGLIINSYCMSFSNPQSIGKSILVTSPLVLIYDVLVLSVGGAVYESIAIISAVIGILRTKRKQA